MRARLPKILATGAAGFIGSAFARQAVKKGYRLIIADKLSYAGDLKRLGEVKGRYAFYRADICDKAALESLVSRERPEAIVNFAAQTHVDRSIQDAAPFIRTNVQGTQVLLEAARKYKIKRFIHISTDEVYGDIKKGSFREDSPLKPNSPYAASKAAADLLIRSYIRTYGFPAIIIRPCNNYGPWQYPEKLIPLAVLKILRKEKVPVYAKGKNIREWLYVEDCAEAILRIIERGKAGQIYNLGSGLEKQNIQVVRTLLKILGYSDRQIEFVRDRPGHDIRYSLDSRHLFRSLGWRPRTDLESGLKSTVNWCLANRQWLLKKWANIAVLYKR